MITITISKKAFFIASLVLLTLLVYSCGQNRSAFVFGGTARVTLPYGMKAYGATWKQDGDLWIFYRPRVEGEKAGIANFSRFQDDGTIYGTVTIAER